MLGAKLLEPRGIVSCTVGLFGRTLKLRRHDRTLKAKRVQYRRRRTETDMSDKCLAHMSTAQSMINHLELRIIMPLDRIQYLT